MAIKQSVVNLNIVAASAITKKRFISRTGAQATAGQNTIGVCDYTVAPGETALCDHLGVTMVEVGAAIPANATERRLQTDADGKAVPFTTGPAVALLLPSESANAAGQLISVILIPN
jgi:regulator of RNase E activity RraA